MQNICLSVYEEIKIKLNICTLTQNIAVLSAGLQSSKYDCRPLVHPRALMLKKWHKNAFGLCFFGGGKTNALPPVVDKP